MAVGLAQTTSATASLAANATAFGLVVQIIVIIVQVRVQPVTSTLVLLKMKPCGIYGNCAYPALGSNFGYGNFTAARAVG